MSSEEGAASGVGDNTVSSGEAREAVSGAGEESGRGESGGCGGGRGE